MCRSSAYSCTQDISIAGTSSIPSPFAASSASATPAIASWSVSAKVLTPASQAAATTSAGASWPSETVECDWSSIIIAQPSEAGATGICSPAPPPHLRWLESGPPLGGRKHSTVLGGGWGNRCLWLRPREASFSAGGGRRGVGSREPPSENKRAAE